ncbi:MAG: tRNA glutamyl-Q(34) synthetase GluQRS [Gammaproteobacteria bacterium]
MKTKNRLYVGRFAPSPTGPLHFGSAVAAIASYLDARANDGRWLLRIEDLDPPREQPGAAGQIIESLAALGLSWDGPIEFQSKRHARYAYAIEYLRTAGRLFTCGCSRREIGPGPYPGTCRDGLAADKKPRSTRFRVDNEIIRFVDAVYGKQAERLADTVGDFNLIRADGLYSYHLAVVVDDAEQGVTNIVRGVDLLPSTARQLALQDALGYPRAHYLHFPVVTDQQGIKLSKQTGAPAINNEEPQRIWSGALKFLRQPDIAGIAELSLAELIEIATANWNTKNLLEDKSAAH